MSFLSPTKTSSVNGPVTVRGASSDNRQITKVELRLGEPVSWIVLSDPYSWDYLFDSAGYANATYATESPPGQQHLETQCLRPRHGHRRQRQDHDHADRLLLLLHRPGPGQAPGHRHLPARRDHERGRPRAHLGDRPGRRRAAPRGDADRRQRGRRFRGLVDFWSGTAKGADGDTLDRFEREDTWYAVTGTSLWSQQINGYGEMYQTEAGHDGDITVRVRAVDTKDGGLTPGIEGDIERVLDPPGRHHPAHRKPQPDIRGLRQGPVPHHRAGSGRRADRDPADQLRRRDQLPAPAGQPVPQPLQPGHRDRYRVSGLKECKDAIGTHGARVDPRGSFPGARWYSCNEKRPIE